MSGKALACVEHTVSAGPIDHFLRYVARNTSVGDPTIRHRYNITTLRPCIHRAPIQYGYSGSLTCLARRPLTVLLPGTRKDGAIGAQCCHCFPAAAQESSTFILCTFLFPQARKSCSQCHCPPNTGPSNAHGTTERLVVIVIASASPSGPGSNEVDLLLLNRRNRLSISDNCGLSLPIHNPDLSPLAK